MIQRPSIAPYTPGALREPPLSVDPIGVKTTSVRVGAGLKAIGSGRTSDAHQVLLEAERANLELDPAISLRHGCAVVP